MNGGSYRTGRLRFSIGVGPVGKAVQTVFVGLFLCVWGTAFLAVALPDVLIIPDLLGWTTPADRRLWLRGLPGEGRIFFVAVTGFASVVLVGALLSIFRHGCFLDGTVVTIRKTFSTRTVDLARATRFWFDHGREHRTDSWGSSFERTTTYIVPQLCVAGYRGVVKIPLADHGIRLPSGELEALAQAIASGGVRPGPYSHESREVVDALRRFARAIPGEHFNLVAWRSWRMRSD